MKDIKTTLKIFKVIKQRKKIIGLCVIRKLKNRHSYSIYEIYQNNKLIFYKNQNKEPFQPGQMYIARFNI